MVDVFSSRGIILDFFTSCEAAIYNVSSQFQSGTDSSYEMLRFVEVIFKRYSVMTTEALINRSVNVRLHCFVCGYSIEI